MLAFIVLAETMHREVETVLVEQVAVGLQRGWEDSGQDVNTPRVTRFPASIFLSAYDPNFSFNPFDLGHERPLMNMNTFVAWI